MQSYKKIGQTIVQQLIKHYTVYTM